MPAAMILAVCSGNVCRSPFVERMLAARVTGTGVEFASAGLAAMAGSAMSPAMAKQLRAAGGSDEGFAARQLTAEMVRAAALVIALERHHRAKIVSVVPGARERTFTLRELGRLLPLLGPPSLPVPQRLAGALPALNAARVAAPPAQPVDDDVPDPFGGTRRDYRGAAELMLRPIEQIAAFLA